MGVRLSWRYQGLCAADGLGRPSLRGQCGGKVYALDARLGCQRWGFDAGFGVRTAITIGEDERGTTLISAINAAKLMHSMPRAESFCGSDESMRMREP
jgi:hypothetical protein